jgi:hypothetical protein
MKTEKRLTEVLVGFLSRSLTILGLVLCLGRTRLTVLGLTLSSKAYTDTSAC